MAKKKAKKQQSKEFYKKPIFVVIFLLVFVAIGSIIVISQAQPKDSLKTQAGPKKKLLFSFTDEKPVIANLENGVVSYVSRPRSIEISTDKTLYCTPQDNGQITSRTLSGAEEGQITSQINQSRSESLPQAVDSAKTAKVNAYRGLAMRDGNNFKNTQIFDTSLESDYVKRSVALLESLCTKPANTIPSEDTPELVASNPAGGKKSLAVKAQEFIAPKAYAGGTTSATGEILDTTAENYQHVRLAEYRKQHGLLATTRDSCLDNQAREWAKQMAHDKWMRHSNAGTQYLDVCPKTPSGFLGTLVTVGENIAYWNIPVSDDPAVSQNASITIFNNFINSPAHNANMLTSTYQFHGIGAYKTADKTQIYLVQAFRYNRGYVPPPTK